MTNNTKTLNFTKEELQVLLDGLDDTVYWRSDPENRNDGEAFPPYAADECQLKMVNDALAMRKRLEEVLLPMLRAEVDSSGD